jgi:hypothetical protein
MYVSCGVLTTSTNDKIKPSRNRPWRHICMFPVRFEHYVHIKSNTISVTGRAVLRVYPAR